MTIHSDELWYLARELHDPNTLGDLRLVANAQPIGLQDLALLDRRIGGPGVSAINRNGTGNYDIGDRDVFRPLQYCEMLIRIGIEHGDLEWRTRDIVEMSCLHIESIVKRIGRVFHLPLGSLLGNAIVKRRVDPVTLDRVRRFTKIYNDAKHNVSHEKDTHLFSIADAIVAYFVSRKLGLLLYHLANLSTDIAIFKIN